MGTLKLNNVTAITESGGVVSLGSSIVLASSSFKLIPGSAPGSPATGQIYYNSTTDKVLVYNGATWDHISNSFATKATGGEITSYKYDSNTYVVHSFTTSGTFTPLSAFNIDYLIVAGGGSTAGGNYSTGSGGGGGGGVLSASSHGVITQAYTITVGAGGIGAANALAGAATNSSIDPASGSIITATAGGQGGSNNYDPGNGGSGGGGGSNIADMSGGDDIPTGQGYEGGSGHANRTGGGGGGAGERGINAATGTGGRGGKGIANSYRIGSPVFYAGGGGGGASDWTDSTGGAGRTSGHGGEGGGGDGGHSAYQDDSVRGKDGAMNTGGGAGGSGLNKDTSNATALVPANGGSGIVIIRYVQ